MRFRAVVPGLAILRWVGWFSCFFHKSKRALSFWLMAGWLLAMLVSTSSAQIPTPVPAFQFGVFYNLDLDFTPGQTMTMNGKVHVNGTLWMCPQANVFFNDTVEATGVVTNKDNPNDQQNLVFNSSNPHYNGGSPLSHVVPLFISPVNANIKATNVETILNLPPAGAGVPNPGAYASSNQLYLYNSCDLVISNAATGINGASVYRTNLSIFFSDVLNPTGPLVLITNDLQWITTNAGVNVTNRYYSFVTNVIFYDFRESKTVQAIQFDVSKFNSWLTNFGTRGGVQIAGYPWNFQSGGANGQTGDKGHPIDSVYVYNSVPPIGSQLPAVRLVNGQRLPSPKGLTIATPMPLYVWGDYNVKTNVGGSTSILTTNTAWTWPAALMGDSITILSANWLDTYLAGGSYSSRPAVSTTVNAACLAGIVPSTFAGGAKHYSGGIENFLRLEENWSGDTLCYNGSLAAMFPSVYATNFWLGPGFYYGVPTRQWSFDVNFLTLAKLPPLTPALAADTNFPAIVTQPQSQMVSPGTTVVFSVTATGFQPLHYQWYKGSNIIFNATASLVLTNVQLAQAGNYSVLVTNLFGSVLSSNALLTVTGSPPTIQQQPTNQTIFVNGTAIFAVVANGTAPLRYQWIFNGTAIAGATNDILTLTGVQLNQAGNYWVQVGNAFGSANSSKAALSVIDLPPAIVSQPTNQSVFINGTATFSVGVTGFPPLNYQWSFNGTGIDGATNVSLTLTNVGFDQAGNYAVQVANAFGSTNSANAILNVIDLPPAIIRQPADQTVYVNGTATFSVGVTGFPPLNYQWSFNGTNIDGATNASLTLGNVQFTQAGNYAVQVANLYGAVLSSNAVLTINPLPPCVPALSGLVSWWLAEGDANDIIGGNNGTLLNGATFAAGEVGQAFTFSGGADGTASPCVQIPYSATLTATNYSVEAWINPAGQVNNGAQQSWIFGESQGEQMVVRPGTTGVKVVFQFKNGSGGFPGVISTNEIPIGQFSHVVGTWDGTTLRLYINGALNNQSAPGSIPVTSGCEFFIGGTYHAAAGGCQTVGQFFNGSVDELSYYNRPLTPDEVQIIYAVGPGGKCPLPPTIIAQPVDQAAAAGDTVSFAVLSTGNLPLSYQWSFNETVIGGATNASLTLTNVQLSEAGNYAVQVVNAYGATNSTDAVLTVIALPPTIQQQPTNQSVFVNSTVMFAVMAGGTTPLSYQWNFNGTDIDGATNASLILTNVQFGQAGNYAVLVTNDYGSILGSNAMLTVNPTPPCVSPPSGLVAWWQAEGNANDSVGTNHGMPFNGVTFTNGMVGQAFHLNGTNQYVQIADAAALKPANVSVEAWVQLDTLVTPGASIPGQEVIVFKKNTRGGNFEGYVLEKNRVAGRDCFTFGIASAAGTQVSAISSTAAQVGPWYHLVGTYDGTTLKLYVNGVLEGSVIAGFPLDYGTRPVFIGQTGEFFDGKFGGTIDEVSIYNRALSAGEIQTIYNARNNGKCPLPPTITVQPADQTAVTGGNVAFNVMAVGSQPLFYQWQCNGTNLVDATNATLTLNAVTADQAGSYSVQIANTAGSVISSNAMLTVLTPPTITTQPADRTNVVGTSASFNVVADGTAPLGYQWQWNGTNLDGATNITLTLTSVTLDQAGNYSVTVTNLAGSVTSSNAVLSVYPTAAATLGGFSFSRDTGFQFQVAGVPGFNYAVQESTNLMDWMLLITNTSPFTFTDTNTTSFPQQFYRAIYVP